MAQPKDVKPPKMSKLTAGACTGAGRLQKIGKSAGSVKKGK